MPRRLKPEDEIQCKVAAALRYAGVPSFHVANEQTLLGLLPGDRARQAYLAAWHAKGGEPGVADTIIVQPPPAIPGSGPAWLELKAPGKRPTKKQAAWMQTAQAWGWSVAWAAGLEPAMRQLVDWGYPVRPEMFGVRLGL